MTRITGFLEGSEGPLNGLLYIKPGGAFIGAPSGALTFEVGNGIVDINLPPCPAAMPYLVDWKRLGDFSRLQFIERWRVPSVEEISLDELRGFHGRQTRGAGRAQGLDSAVWKAEAEEAKRKIAELEGQVSKLLQKVNTSEARAASNAGKLASLLSENSGLKSKLANAVSHKREVEERIVEKRVLPDEARASIAAARNELTILQRENEELKKQAENGIAFSTHFSNMQHEIDRLRDENRRLLSRIEELKQPQRSASSLRREMIANLDKLIEG